MNFKNIRQENKMNSITGNLRTVLDNLYDGVYLVDKNRKILYWNKAAEEITGYLSSEVVGTSCQDNKLNHVDSKGKNYCKDECPLLAIFNDGEMKELEIFLHHKEGYRIPIYAKVIPYKNEEGDLVGALEVFSERTERKMILKRIKELETLAMLDALTQLPNRRYIEDFIDLKLKEYLMDDIPFGLIYMDVDYFKKINDVYNHDVGDLVLKTISKTYLNNLRGDDVIGRWGGEEFIGVFSGVDESELEKIATKLRILIEKTVIDIGDRDLKVTISSGATLIKPDDTLKTLLKRSDILLYESKRKGRNRITMG